MKRLLLILLVLLPFLVRGQNASWRCFDRYTKAEGFTSIQLERKMMRMMSRQAAEKGDRGLAELLGGIGTIRIVSGWTGRTERSSLPTQAKARRRIRISNSSW
ncbi:MAG: DUF4252 domain-containing protein [Alistipes senegalensis]